MRMNNVDQARGAKLARHVDESRRNPREETNKEGSSMG